jgi:hypothetical protein
MSRSTRDPGFLECWGQTQKQSLRLEVKRDNCDKRFWGAKGGGTGRPAGGAREHPAQCTAPSTVLGGRAATCDPFAFLCPVAP